MSKLKEESTKLKELQKFNYVLPSRFYPTQADAAEVVARYLHGKGLSRTSISNSVGSRTKLVRYNFHVLFQHKKVSALATTVKWEPRTSGLVQPRPGRSVVEIQISDTPTTVVRKGLTSY